MANRPVVARSLLPREHGAYIQLLLPLVTALIATQPGLAPSLLALAASLVFLASEPLRVLLGDRGPRLQQAAGRRARWRLAALGASALLVGVAGLALAPRSALWASLLMVAPIGVMVVAARRRALDTVGGELVAAATLCGAAAPVAVAGGLSIGDAVVWWAAWSLAYAATVIAVHHVIGSHRGARPPGHARLWLGLVCVGFGALIGLRSAAWFTAPLIAVALAVVALTPAATRLRTIGFSFLAGSVVSAVCAIVSADRGSALGPLTPGPQLHDDLGLDLGGEALDRGKDDALLQLEMSGHRFGDGRGDAPEPYRGRRGPPAGPDVSADLDQVTDLGAVRLVIGIHRREGRVDLRTGSAQARREAVVLVGKMQRERAREVAMDVPGHGGGGVGLDSLARGEVLGGAQERADPHVALAEQSDQPLWGTPSPDRHQHREGSMHPMCPRCYTPAIANA